MTMRKAKAPTHRLYVVNKGRDGEKDFWVRIGSAWPHKSGVGFNIRFDALPIGGECVMLDESENPADDTQH